MRFYIICDHLILQTEIHGQSGRSLPGSVLVFLVKNSDCECDRLTNLKQHIRYHDKKKEYCCTICSSEFTRPDDFRKHLINFHNIHVSATLLKSSYHYP